jgi:hypothetical protein
MNSVAQVCPVWEETIAGKLRRVKPYSDPFSSLENGLLVFSSHLVENVELAIVIADSFELIGRHFKLSYCQIKEERGKANDLVCSETHEIEAERFEEHRKGRLSRVSGIL